MSALIIEETTRNRGGFMDYIIMKENVETFRRQLISEEKSAGTIEKYMREVKVLLDFMMGKEWKKEMLIAYKQFLSEKYATATVNSFLVAANRFVVFVGRADLKVKLHKVQKQIFADQEKELSKEEYMRLVITAQKQGNQRLALVLQTICGTGIRVSELRFITAEAVKRGQAEVRCKGKNRIIFLPEKLQRRLRDYMAKTGIKKGAIFITKSGKSLDRSNIWNEMKKLCEEASVPREKVFPHNLRHLFARVFYNMEKDIAKLADLLGHSSIETTRIYIMESGELHRRKLNQMRLIL